MIDAVVVTTQMERLEGLSYFPRDNRETLKDLRMALEAADNEAICMAVVNWWVEHNSEAPKPAEIRRLIWDENNARRDEAEARKPPPRVHCAICKDAGVTGGVIGGKGIDAGPCKWCTCETALEMQRTPQQEDYTMTRNRDYVDRVNHSMEVIAKLQYAPHERFEILAHRALGHKIVRGRRR